MLFVKKNLARALLNDPTTSKIIYYAHFKLLYKPTMKIINNYYYIIIMIFVYKFKK